MVERLRPANPPSTGGGTPHKTLPISPHPIPPVHHIIPTPQPKPHPTPPLNPRAHLSTTLPANPVLNATVTKASMENNILTITCSYTANWNFPLANLEIQGSVGDQDFNLENATYTTFEIIISSNSYANALTNNGGQLMVTTTVWNDWQNIISNITFSENVTASQGTINVNGTPTGDVNITATPKSTPKPTPPATIPPTNYNASGVTSMDSYNGSVDFTYQGTASDKRVSLVGGNLGKTYDCTPYGTNEFYCYVSVPNTSETYALYYLVSINDGEPELDPDNINIGIYQGHKCSYYLYTPN